MNLFALLRQDISMVSPDCGALPEGYRPQPQLGDLRVIWRNLDNPEKSWIDTWRNERDGKLATARQLLWVQEITGSGGYSGSGDFLYYRITARAKAEGSSLSIERGVDMICGVPNHSWTCSSEVPSGQLPQEVPVSQPGGRSPSPPPYNWEVWLERADAPESVIGNTEVFRAWQQDPRRGLRFQDQGTSGSPE